MLKKPVMIITGASSGIGEATARLFGVEHGYRLVLAARRADRLRTLADEIEASGGRVLPVPTDITQLDQVQRLVDLTLENFGQVDILFNNAGFGKLRFLEQLDPLVEIEPQIQVNLLGLIYTTQAVLPQMIQRRKGHIINMSSVAGLAAPPKYSIYSATKFAVHGFTEALRREVRTLGIQVSGVYPGPVDTEFNLHTGAVHGYGFSTPEFLRLTSDDVAKTILKLVRHPCRMAVIPWQMKVGVWLNAFFPSLIDWFVRQIFPRR
ncbi:MAG: SDR family oxidoreductase [Chloroflexota bacterium]|nr:SDR family oxidoreductase [Chloroflexota bacterium]